MTLTLTLTLGTDKSLAFDPIDPAINVALTHCIDDLVAQANCQD